MQEQKLDQGRDSWLELRSKKEVMFFLHLFDSQLIVKNLLILNDEYARASELREVGISKVNVELIFYGIVECAYMDTVKYYRLTKMGMELKEKLFELIDISKKVIYGANLDQSTTSSEEAIRTVSK